MTENDRGKTFAKKALWKACERLFRLKTDRAHALETVAIELGSMVKEGWIQDHEVSAKLMRACVLNGLVDFDGQSAVMATIREGLIAGQKQPPPVLPGLGAGILNNGTLNRIRRVPSKADREAARKKSARWRAENRERHAAYQREWMRCWRARRREIST